MRLDFHENKAMETQTLYQEAIRYAAARHQENNQKLPGTDLPYLVHLSNVAMEVIIAASQSNHFNLDYAVQVALLHDTIEDTSATIAELEDRFGVEIAKGVWALTKNSDLPKEQQMPDTLTRIKLLPFEVWAVKLADRITNLQAPPKNWDQKKKVNYHKDSTMILNGLQKGNSYLAKRLETKIKEYEAYILT